MKAPLNSNEECYTCRILEVGMVRDHTDWKTILFLMGLSLLVCHELDAMTHQEWLLLPTLNALPGETARTVFVIVHIPLLTVVFWLVSHQSSGVRRRSQVAFDGFLAIHAILHFLMSGHDQYSFEAPLEGLLVYGAAVAGLSHLLVTYRSQTA